MTAAVVGLEAVVEPPDLPIGKAGNEALEDYTLRFAPRSYRRWGTGVVAISALGGIAYLADFAIGANIGLSYGTTNALWGIAVFAVVIFLTGRLRLDGRGGRRLGAGLLRRPGQRPQTGSDQVRTSGDRRLLATTRRPSSTW